MNLNIFAKVIISSNGVVQRIVPVMGVDLAPNESARLVSNDVAVKINDLDDGKSISPNPKQAEMDAVAAKKLAIAQQLLGAKTDAELKAAVSAINADVNS